MPFKWEDIELDTKVFRNLDEDVLRRSAVTLENAFINEAKGHSRFPGLNRFATLPGGKVFLHDWREDMVAVTTAGKIFRLDENGNTEDITGVIPTGTGRVTFAKTDDQLAMAAGGDIVQYAGKRTEILSTGAPRSTHIGYLAGYLLAIENNSGRFYHSAAGAFRDWDPLDVFTAEYNPDPLVALLITEFGEALLAGKASIEQHEPYPGGDRPFFRRWSVGQGVSAPYTLVSADNGVWAVNRLDEFVRFSGQSSKPQSDDVALLLSKVDNFSDAWAALTNNLFGQKFIVLTLPQATNPYGTTGLTLLFDIRQKRWSFLYGWDDDLKLPSLYPMNSYHALWGRHFAGGYNGEILEFDDTIFTNDGMIQPMLYRTAHNDQFGRIRLNDLRMRFKRGVGAYNDPDPPLIQLRVRRDALAWGKWQLKSLGFPGQNDPYIYFGQQGLGHTFQFEYRITDPVNVQLAAMQIRATQIG